MGEFKMISFSSRPIALQHHNVVTNRIYVSDNGTVVIAEVLTDTEIFQNDALRSDLLFVKEELEKTDVVNPVTFLIDRKGQFFAYGVDEWQRFVSQLKDPAHYLMKMLSSKKESWVDSMISATKSEV